MPNTTSESHKNATDPGNSTFTSSIAQAVGKKGSDEEPDEDEANNAVDLAEEEEMQLHGQPAESVFATGVSFEELSEIQTFILNDEPTPEEEKKAADVVKKIEGTEILKRFEASMENAARKIAILLDKSAGDSDSGSSLFKDDFNIQNFV